MGVLLERNCANSVRQRVKQRREDAVNGRDKPNDDGPDARDEVGGDGVVEVGIAPNVLENIVAVAMNDVFYAGVSDKLNRKTGGTHVMRYIR
jgi:hypothetical protein